MDIDLWAAQRRIGAFDKVFHLSNNSSLPHAEGVSQQCQAYHRIASGTSFDAQSPAMMAVQLSMQRQR